jgi:hypothetical protein
VRVGAPLLVLGVPLLPLLFEGRHDAILSLPGEWEIGCLFTAGPLG